MLQILKTDEAKKSTGTSRDVVEESNNTLILLCKWLEKEPYSLNDDQEQIDNP